ncbi:TPA: carbamate kinase [Staphylococcus aureus]|nr:carbamate kinase [Staphylococcus aureus]
MKEKIVIALGGNAIQTKEATAEAQQTAIRRAMQNLKPLFDSPARIVISHGNGPQIGSLLIQQAKSNSDTTPAMPLDTCGAMSQGMIGYWLETEINRILTEMNSDRTVGTIVTRVEVDKDDPRFNNPTKPIGPFYTKEDAGRGYRKVVASPLPQSILEHQLIRTLADGKNIVIACGGGGIPVIKKENTYEGVEAVIDKDFASEKLATLIEADTLMILTNVENVFINFNEPNQQQIDDIDVATLKKYAAQGKFAEGSMLPKIEAAIRFVESGENKKVIITNLEQAYEALIGNKGTHIHM